MSECCPFETNATKTVRHHVPFCWFHKGHFIEVSLTIFGGHRVTIREYDSMFYTANWCAGANEGHVQTLVRLAAAVIDLGIDYPNYSRVKPYYNDQEFLAFMDGVEEIFKKKSEAELL